MSKNKLKEELSTEEYNRIRQIIRMEVARIFFDLYRKKSVWSK